MPLVASRFAGWLLRGGVAVLLLLRRPRPIHSSGAVFDGRMTPRRAAVPSGIGWIDDPPDGEDDCREPDAHCPFADSVHSSSGCGIRARIP